MTPKWEAVIVDRDERKVFEALADESWDFRTLDGLQRSTGLTRERIEEVVEKHPGFIRRSALRDPKGRQLYLLEERHETFAEMLSTLRVLVSKTVA